MYVGNIFTWKYSEAHIHLSVINSKKESSINIAFLVPSKDY